MPLHLEVEINHINFNMEVWKKYDVFTQDFLSLWVFRKHWIGREQCDRWLAQKEESHKWGHEHRAGVQQVSVWCPHLGQAPHSIQKAGLSAHCLILTYLSSSDTQTDALRADLQQSAWFLWLSRHRYLIAWKGWEWKRCYALTPVDNGYSNQRWMLKTDSIRFQSVLMPCGWDPALVT